MVHESLTQVNIKGECMKQMNFCEVQMRNELKKLSSHLMSNLSNCLGKQFNQLPSRQHSWSGLVELQP